MEPLKIPLFRVTQVLVALELKMIITELGVYSIIHAHSQIREVLQI